jgi:hypothetical protein
MAAAPSGATAQQVYEEAVRRGDTVTIESYHNLGRRLAHRGLLVRADADSRQTVFKVGSIVDGQWLDEEHLAAIVDPEYPLIALTVMKEVGRQINSVPEAVWEEVRTRLRAVNARDLFFEQIKAYADDLRDALREYALHTDAQPSERTRLKGQIEGGIALLKEVTKHGLGLSNDAIRVPPTFESGLEAANNRPNSPFYFEEPLRDEIERRIADENFIVDVPMEIANPSLLIAAVDGSTRSGLLTMEGEEGDFTLGHAPAVSINTSTAQTNREIKVGTRQYPAFIRLPEKPEDMQQRDNKYTIMAKLFFPDLTESQYAHSVWNAMNLLECRAALRVMRRWETSRDSLEVRPADVVMMDGPVTPQDRDSKHYAQSGSYGRIVRDLIEVNYEIMQKSSADNQVVAGVVKNSPLRVLGPILNRFIAQAIAKPGERTQIQAWPLQAMNSQADRAILTRLLTAGRKKGEPWSRTCLVSRPFHATTDFAEGYSRDDERRPSAQLIRRARDAQDDATFGTSFGDFDFWKEFRGEHDPYVKLLDNAWYTFFHVGAMPRLDQKQSLPRMEVLAVGDTRERGPICPKIATNCAVFLDALKITGFNVANEHALFGARGWIDVLPRLLIDVHYTVKIWAAELQSRVQEYIGYHMSKYLKGRSFRGVRIRPWRPAELQAWITQMTEERRRQAGTRAEDPNGKSGYLT